MRDDRFEESVLRKFIRRAFVFLCTLVLAGFLVFGVCTLVMRG